MGEQFQSLGDHGPLCFLRSVEVPDIDLVTVMLHLGEPSVEAAVPIHATDTCRGVDLCPGAILGVLLVGRQPEMRRIDAVLRARGQVVKLDPLRNGTNELLPRLAACGGERRTRGTNTPGT